MMIPLSRKKRGKLPSYGLIGAVNVKVLAFLWVVGTLCLMHDSSN